MLFRRLAVFRGGWTLAAAETVVTDVELPGGGCWSCWSALFGSRWSLPTRPTATSVTACWKRCGSTRPANSPTPASRPQWTLRTPRTSWRWANRRRPVCVAPPGPVVAALRAEHANLRAALSWMVATDGQVDQAQRLVGSLGLYWHLGRHLEGREVLRRVIALPGGAPHTRARALQSLSLVERPRACIVHPSTQCAAAAGKASISFSSWGTAVEPRSPSCCWPWRASAAAPTPTPTRPCGTPTVSSLRWAKTGAVR